MGIVWEAYHKGVPLLGVPRITLDIVIFDDLSSILVVLPEVKFNESKFPSPQKGKPLGIIPQNDNRPKNVKS